jgi:hypothetical protein
VTTCRLVDQHAVCFLPVLACLIGP